MVLSAVHTATNDGRAGRSVFYFKLLALVVLLSDIDGNHGMDAPGLILQVTSGGFFEKGDALLAILFV